MKRFKLTLFIGLAAILALLIANACFLVNLYAHLKKEAISQVQECLQQADIQEMIWRIQREYGVDDSELNLSVSIKGTKTASGAHLFPNFFNQVSDSIGIGLHRSFEIDGDNLRPDLSLLDSLFRAELNVMGFHPEHTLIVPAYEHLDSTPNDMWRCNLNLGETQPVYTAYFSSLGTRVLQQMLGIILTSICAWAIVALLFWLLIHQVSQLRTIEQMKDDFTHNMTHELKTPVSVVQAATESMIRYYETTDDANKKKYLSIILQKLNHLSGMIDNILSMSMERFKNIQLNIDHINIREEVESLVKMFEVKETKPIKVSVDIPDRCMLKTDPLHFRNVVSNLLDNAIKYSGDMVEICIKANSHFFQIEDNGIGIAPKDLSHIFEKFYRVGNGYHYTPGYGLGLYYVQNIVKVMGWKITVKSDSRKGTSFKIIFDKAILS